MWLLSKLRGVIKREAQELEFLNIRMDAGGLVGCIDDSGGVVLGTNRDHGIRLA